MLFCVTLSLCLSLLLPLLPPHTHRHTFSSRLQFIHIYANTYPHECMPACIYVYIHKHASRQELADKHTRTCMRLQPHKHPSPFTHTHTHTHTHKHTHTHTPTRTPTHTHTHTHTRTHTHTHTHTHIHTHTHTRLTCDGCSAGVRQEIAAVHRNKRRIWTCEDMERGRALPLMAMALQNPELQPRNRTVTSVCKL